MLLSLSRLVRQILVHLGFVAVRRLRHTQWFLAKNRRGGCWLQGVISALVFRIQREGFIRSVRFPTSTVCVQIEVKTCQEFSQMHCIVLINPTYVIERMDSDCSPVFSLRPPWVVKPTLIFECNDFRPAR